VNAATENIILLTHRTSNTHVIISITNELANSLRTKKYNGEAHDVR